MRHLKTTTTATNTTALLDRLRQSFCKRLLWKKNPNPRKRNPNRGKRNPNFWLRRIVGFQGFIGPLKGKSSPVSFSEGLAGHLRASAARLAGLAGAMHGPDFAAHVDEMKSASREFADGHDVAGIDRRPGIWRR